MSRRSVDPPNPAAIGISFLGFLAAAPGVETRPNCRRPTPVCSRAAIVLIPVWAKGALILARSSPLVFPESGFASKASSRLAAFGRRNRIGCEWVFGDYEFYRRANVAPFLIASQSLGRLR